MGSITAQKIIDRAERTLQDETNVQWTESELLEYLNDAQRDIVAKKPDANPVNGSIQLAPGTKQTIPANGSRFMYLTRNMGADGNTVGQVILEADMTTLDHTDRNWHTGTPSATVDNFMPAKDDNKVFYVKPPQPATGMGYVEMVYSENPADISITSAITLDDSMANPIRNYILFRAHSKEVDSPDQTKAAAYWQLYLQDLGLKAAQDDEINAGRRTR